MDTLHDLNSRYPWPFLETSASVTLTSGVAAPTMPADFQSVKTLIIPSAGVSLRSIRRDEVLKRFPATFEETGTPWGFYLVGEELRTIWVPDQDYTAVCDYYMQQGDLTDGSLSDDILLPSRHHRAVVVGALSRLYAMEDDPDLAATFGGLYEARIATMANDLIMRQWDAPERMHDVWDCD
jgi:hypothetical protein